MFPPIDNGVDEEGTIGFAIYFPASTATALGMGAVFLVRS